MRDFEELCFQPIDSVSSLLLGKQISARELTIAMLDRIERLDEEFGSYAVVDRDAAVQQAEKVDREIADGHYKGKLHGIPIAVKDLVAVQGLEMACGSTLLPKKASTANATVATRLIDAGAVIVGKTAMTEFALAGYNPAFEAPRNPWRLDCWSGVSSSGSGVAAAARLCFGAVASDTGGSIRFPSAANGVVGIKPTFGAVSKVGCFPLAHSLDHIGPIAKSVSDAALLLQAMMGRDAMDPYSADDTGSLNLGSLHQGVSGMSIGVDWEYCEHSVDPEVFAAVQQAASFLERQGARIIEVSVAGIESACQEWYALTAIEALSAHCEFFPARMNEYGPTFRSLLEYGQTLSGLDVVRAYEAIPLTRQAMARILAPIDCMICPSAATPAPLVRDFPPDVVMPPEAVASIMSFAAPYNFSGVPTISVPAGFSSDGLPLGIQFVAARGAEATLLSVAHCYEQGHGWKDAVPSSAR